MRRHRLTPFVALLAIGLAAVNGHAAEPLLKPGQITESALVDALTPADEDKLALALTGKAGTRPPN